MKQKDFAAQAEQMDLTGIRGDGGRWGGGGGEKSTPEWTPRSVHARLCAR